MALQFAFEDTGTGPPVVVLHGLFGSSANWRSVARALAPHHRVLCVDLRNHGQSQWADSMDSLEMADDVRQNRAYVLAAIEVKYRDVFGRDQHLFAVRARTGELTKTGGELSIFTGLNRAS